VDDDLRCLRAVVRETEVSPQVVWEWDGLEGAGDADSENRRREPAGSDGEGAVEGRPLDLRFLR
jgi:hypothetical protein